MFYLTIILFALAAILGVVILKNWLTAGNTSKTVIYGHGLFAAAGLVLLVVMYLNNPENSTRNSLILFGLAAIVGFYMFFRDLKGKFSPTWMAVVHGLVAVAAFVILLFQVI